MSSYVLSVSGSRRCASSFRRPAIIESIRRLIAASRIANRSRFLATELTAMSDGQLYDLGIDQDAVARMVLTGQR